MLVPSCWSWMACSIAQAFIDVISLGGFLSLFCLLSSEREAPTMYVIWWQWAAYNWLDQRKRCQAAEDASWCLMMWKGDSLFDGIQYGTRTGFTIRFSNFFSPLAQGKRKRQKRLFYRERQRYAVKNGIHHCPIGRGKRVRSVWWRSGRHAQDRFLQRQHQRRCRFSLSLSIFPFLFVFSFFTTNAWLYSILSFPFDWIHLVLKCRRVKIRLLSNLSSLQQQQLPLSTRNARCCAHTYICTSVLYI